MAGALACDARRNPNKPDQMPALLRRLAVSTSQALLIMAMSAPIACSKYDGPAEIARAQSSGTRVTATIVSAADTRSRRDALHYVRFKLQVQADAGVGGQGFLLESTTLLNPYDFPRYPPGATVQVRYLEDNRDYFAFVE